MKYKAIGASWVCLLLFACEKEIKVDLPPSPTEIVVEAYINPTFPYLNYVFISRTVDYFSPSISANALNQADVFITEGVISGNDTVYDNTSKVQLVQLPDSLLPGVYTSPFLKGKEGKTYLLEIYVDGHYITGKTTIPPSVPIDTVFWRSEENGDAAYLSIAFQDPPAQNNYRLGITVKDQTLGWGSVDRLRNFDDEQINNAPRTYTFFQPIAKNEEVTVYLTTIGRREYLFWRSYVQARNNNGPFATPVRVRSTLKGAIGCFTGMGISRKTVSIK